MYRPISLHQSPLWAECLVSFSHSLRLRAKRRSHCEAVWSSWREYCEWSCATALVLLTFVFPISNITSYTLIIIQESSKSWIWGRPVYRICFVAVGTFAIRQVSQFMIMILIITANALVVGCRLFTDNNIIFLSIICFIYWLQYYSRSSFTKEDYKQLKYYKINAVILSL